MSSILGFSGEYKFLSNFHLVDITWKGTQFTCSEHIYMFFKCTTEEDRKAILQLSKPGDIKKFGRSVKLPKNWGDIRDVAMMTALLAKFSIPEMAEKLLSTKGMYIEETNWWNDTYWGVCNGVGENKLGRMLMFIRDFHMEK